MHGIFKKPCNTCETLISEPLEPATTMTLKLLNSVRDLFADPPVLSLASFKILLTMFSKVCLNVLPNKNSTLLFKFEHHVCKVGSSKVDAEEDNGITQCCEKWMTGKLYIS